MGGDFLSLEPSPPGGVMCSGQLGCSQPVGSLPFWFEIENKLIRDSISKVGRSKIIRGL